jgi:hypothetical protein
MEVTMKYMPDGTEISAAGNDLYIGGVGGDGGIIGDVAGSVVDGAGDVVRTASDAVTSHLGDVASSAADLAIPFPVGLAVGLAARKMLIENGMDPKSAKRWGRVAGWTTSAITIWGGAP